MSEEVRIGLSIWGPSPGDELQLQTHRLDRQKEVRKDNRRVDIEDFDRLQRYGRGQVRPFADFEDTVAWHEYHGTASDTVRLAA